MDIKFANCTSSPKAQEPDKYAKEKEAIVSKVSTEFFSRVYSGEDKESALENAFKALSEKNAPKEDKVVIGSGEEMLGGIKAKAMKLPSPAEATAWIGVITALVDLSFHIFDGINTRKPQEKNTNLESKIA